MLIGVFGMLAFITGVIRPARLNKGDTLFLLDSTWHLKRIWKSIRYVHKNGVIIGFCLYDLFPLRYPQFCDVNLVKSFEYWLDQVVKYSEFSVTISKYVGEDLKSYLKENNKLNSKCFKKCAHFKLGVNLDLKLKDQEIRSKVKNIFENNHDGKPYLMVSTIEPRKNHKYLLDVFDILWNREYNVNLLIIGKVGWKCDEIINRIKNHPKFRKRLFVYHDINDTELLYCYKNAKALVFPSLAEGFGLPIVEALSKGLPVFASDIPTHKEVGSNFCIFFDLNNPIDLVEKMIEFEKHSDGNETENSLNFKWVNGRESCESLIETILELTN